MESHISRTLGIAAFATLLAALILSVPVLERLIAAIWQWYKFLGYSDDGVITLGLRTGLVFSGLVAALFCLALCLHLLGKRHAVAGAIVFSNWAMCVSVAVLVVYWLLGISSLNAWRA